MIKIINGFYQQTLFQRDGEAMRQHIMRIESRSNVASKISKIMPEISETYRKYAEAKKKQLCLAI